ncbi:MAG: OmpA family protein [Cocleimonas sp.]
MKKSSLKTSIALTLIASGLWGYGSWYYYSCKIKNTCDTKQQDIASINTPVTKTPITTINKSQQIDTDGDGLSDFEEARLGTDPLLTDTDNDKTPDSEEIGVNLDSPLDTDKDGIIDALDLDDDNDGIPTLIESQIGTSPLYADTDEDGILDADEIGADTNNPIDTDSDGIINALDTDDDDDGIETIAEIALGTNQLLADSDSDGLTDAQEIGEQLDQPLDSDNDGIIDALDTEEVLDQDEDGLTDTLEAQLKLNPNNKDSDGDGISDAKEVGENTNTPLDTDHDGIIDALDIVDDSDDDNDSLTNAQEIKLASNPKNNDSDGDGINDNEEVGSNISDPLDTDADGILNLNDPDDDNDSLETKFEIKIGTNPLSTDSDGDGIADNLEIGSNKEQLQDTDKDGQINAVDTDDDNDKLPTSIELTLGTNPLKADTDGDGISDVIEVGKNTDKPIDSDGDGKIDALDASNKNEVEGTGIKVAVKDDETSKPVDTDITTPTADDSKNNSISIVTITPAKDGSISTTHIYLPLLSSTVTSTEESTKYFKHVAEWMNSNTKNKINIIGHTDNTGSKQSNLALGISHVMVIREILIKTGAPMSQIDIMSRGESQPIADNSTKEGRLKNRRVEITTVPVKP